VADKDNFKRLLNEGVKNFLIPIDKAKNWNLKEIIKKYKINAFLDSGIGKNINVDEYCDFIKINGIQLYANKDIMGDPEQTLRNQRYMESRGLHPLPVFHAEDVLKNEKNWKYLVDYAKDPKYDVICIAGSKDNNQITFWTKVFNTCKGKKIHAFGVGSVRILTSFPFYSTDIRDWFHGSVYGRIHYGESQIDYKNRQFMEGIKPDIEELGCDFSLMIQENGNSERDRYNIRFYNKLEFKQQIAKEIKYEFDIIPIEKIKPCPFELRQKDDANELKMLEESILEDGLFNNLVVRAVEDDYELVCGNRRFLKLIRIGCTNVPCHILRNCSREKAMEIALKENTLRRNLSDEELSTILDKMKADYEKRYPEARRGGSHRQEGFVKKLCKTINRSESWIREKINYVSNNRKCGLKIPKDLTSKQRRLMKKHIEKHGEKNIREAIELVRRDVDITKVEVGRTSAAKFITELGKIKKQLKWILDMRPVFSSKEKEDSVEILNKMSGMIEESIEHLSH
jgi:ParB/RepB/Spo0J family partition protein